MKKIGHSIKKENCRKKEKTFSSLQFHLRPQLKIVLLLIALCSVLFFVFIFLNSQEQNLVVGINPKEPLTPANIDFTNTDSGTFTGWSGQQYFQEPIDSVVILFASAKIPSLTLIYYPQEKKIIGGTSQMVAEDIALFEGNFHQITYTFDREGEQRLYYDARLVASSEFQPSFGSQIQGMIAGASEAFISPAWEKVEIS